MAGPGVPATEDELLLARDIVIVFVVNLTKGRTGGSRNECGELLSKRIPYAEDVRRGERSDR